MFTPIHLLPQFSGEDRAKYQNRWYSTEGHGLQDRITRRIREGAGEDFLQPLFEGPGRGFLESDSDLRGFSLPREDIEFSGGDNFEGVDFSHALITNCRFKGAWLVNGTTFAFAWLWGCTFESCVFISSSFFGADRRDVTFLNCDFDELQGDFCNCDMRNVRLRNCFMPRRLFFDCRFDGQTRVEGIAEQPTCDTRTPEGVLAKTQLVEIHKGIKEGYLAGEAYGLYRKSFLEERKASTRHNCRGRHKAWGLALEYLAGYGVRPLRVLAALAIVFVLCSLGFCCAPGVHFSQDLLMSSGALFTFGGGTPQLETLGAGWRAFYALEAFLGVALMALFITVLARRWFIER